LDTLDNKRLMLKPENVCPLSSFRSSSYDLAQERIASIEEHHRIQIKAKGVKHVNTARLCGYPTWRHIRPLR